MRVWWPPAIAAQPAAWAGVGASKLEANQSRTAGEKAASGSGRVAGWPARAVRGTGAEYRPEGPFRPDVRYADGRMARAFRAIRLTRGAAWPL